MLRKCETPENHQQLEIQLSHKRWFRWTLSTDEKKQSSFYRGIKMRMRVIRKQLKIKRNVVRAIESDLIHLVYYVFGVVNKESAEKELTIKRLY